jgi:hypothetical protein
MLWIKWLGCVFIELLGSMKLLERRMISQMTMEREKSEEKWEGSEGEGETF